MDTAAVLIIACGCHNPETHSFSGGFEKEVEDLKEEIAKLTGQDGITFSGGDPMFQPTACTELAKFAKEQGLNVWCWTGFTFEELLKSGKEILAFLSYIDVLVDGRFEEEKKTFALRFRGSANQRLLDVAKSLKQGKAVAIKEESANIEPSYGKIDHMYI